MPNGGVYKITNIVNNKCYIGSAANIYKRWSWHKRYLTLNNHHSILLQRAWNKYGETNFKFEILECGMIDPKDLIKREQYYIDIFKCYEPSKGYNVYKIAGSPKGYKHTAETKLKISIINKGKSMSAEAKAKMSAYQLNRSDEHKKNMSLSLKKRVFSAEHRKKLSEANRRRYAK